MKAELSLYTFGLKYPTPTEEHPDNYWYEEIDVEAPDPRIARKMALEIANADYEPGWVAMVAMPAGGSCGTVTIISYNTGGNNG